MSDEEYKSVLIVNDSADAHVTFYQYAQWDVICWLSVESKILKPGEKYLHRSKQRFQFKMVARFQDNQRPAKTILELQPWDGDKLLKVTGGSGTATPTVTEEALIDQVEKRICLRKIQRDKELKRTRRGRNFYEILGLDIEEVREMSKEQQAKAIKKGFDTQMRVWHPDRNGGDEEITKEILFAYETLENEEKRARYNNLTDYDEGPLSLRHYKAIFKPEGCSYKDWCMKVCIGLAGGAVTGGSAVGITAALTGIGSAALENRSPGEHVVNGLKNAAGDLALGAARDSVAACMNHAFNEVQVDRRLKKEFENPLVDDEAKPSGSKPFQRRSRARFVLDEENGEGLHNWRAGKCSTTYKPLNTEDTPDLIPENLVSFSEELANIELETDEQPEDGKVKYISNGAWSSKMVVTFFENSKKVTKEVKGSGKSINIPSSARKIEVRFQVSRPFWGDVCKYDRFHKSWFTPYEPHIFRYDTPPIRTFIISGGLWWEAVMRVSDEYHEETKEM